MRKISVHNLKNVLAIISFLLGYCLTANAQSQANQDEKWFEKTSIDHQTRSVRSLLKNKESNVMETAEGLTFMVNTKADSLKMIFPFRGEMRRLKGNYWLVDYKLKDASRSIINWGYISYKDGQSSLHHGEGWRGQLVKEPYPASEKLEGVVSDHKFDSKIMGQERDITVYLPPGHDRKKRYPVLYVADGWWANELAKRIDPMILSGALKPVLIVGIHSMPYDGERTADFSDHDPKKDIRAREYIKDYLSSQELIDGEDPVFANHMKFFTEEVPQWAQEQFGASPHKREKLVAGYSNGAAFVASLLAAHPEKAGAATMLSLAGWGNVVDSLDLAPSTYPKMYMAAGRYEKGFLRNAEGVFNKLLDYGCDVEFKKTLTGHDMVMWNEEMINNLVDYFDNYLQKEIRYPQEAIQILESLEEKDQELRLEMIEMGKKLGEQSQEYRDFLMKTDFLERMHKRDKDNMQVLEGLIKQYGWPHTSISSKKANRTAFFIVQHNDLVSQEKYLPILLESARRGETPGSMVALLQDRVLMRQGKKQIYGSQLSGLNGEYVVWTIEDPEHVDERRAAVGLGPLSEYLKHFDMEYKDLPLEQMPSTGKRGQ